MSTLLQSRWSCSILEIEYSRLADNCYTKTKIPSSSKLTASLRVTKATADYEDHITVVEKEIVCNDSTYELWTEMAVLCKDLSCLLRVELINSTKTNLAGSFSSLVVLFLQTKEGISDCNYSPIYVSSPHVKRNTWIGSFPTDCDIVSCSHLSSKNHWPKPGQKKPRKIISGRM